MRKWENAESGDLENEMRKFMLDAYKKCRDKGMSHEEVKHRLLAIGGTGDEENYWVTMHFFEPVDYIELSPGFALTTAGNLIRAVGVMLEDRELTVLGMAFMRKYGDVFWEEATTENTKDKGGDKH